MLRLGRQTIDIPAGQARYIVTDSYVLPVDVDVVALQPHAHYRLRDARGDATLPDGTVKPLLHIGDWDFRWQHVYRYESPLSLPKGTKISMQYTYDNSAANPRNPEQPPKRARWGQRSADEMGDLWIQALTRDEADLVALDNEFRRKVVAEDVNGYEMEIERHPNDAGLAAIPPRCCTWSSAASSRPSRTFRERSRSKGQSAPAHYNLGTALTMGRQFDQAVYQYQQAIRIDPGYAPAHNNLGNVYLAQGKVDEAIAEFREVVRLQPDSSTAKANLAAALRHAASASLNHAPSERERGDPARSPQDPRVLVHRLDLRLLRSAASEFPRRVDAARPRSRSRAIRRRGPPRHGARVHGGWRAARRRARGSLRPQAAADGHDPRLLRRHAALGRVHWHVVDARRRARSPASASAASGRSRTRWSAKRCRRTSVDATARICRAAPRSPASSRRWSARSPRPG